MTSVVFLDCETTGLHPEQHRIWEFAGIRRDLDTMQETRMHLQIAGSLEDADPFALNIGKFWERFGSQGEWNPMSTPEWVGFLSDFSEVPQKGEIVDSGMAAGLIRQFTHDAHLVGNCISFDAERIARLFYGENLLPTYHYHIIDIEPMIVGYAKAKGKTFPLPYSSSAVSEWLGVEEPTEAERHTAMGDAEWVMRQWDAIHS